jgi:hypothetical protein
LIRRNGIRANKMQIDQKKWNLYKTKGNSVKQNRFRSNKTKFYRTKFYQTNENLIKLNKIQPNKNIFDQTKQKFDLRDFRSNKVKFDQLIDPLLF